MYINLKNMNKYCYDYGKLLEKIEDMLTKKISKLN